MTTPDEIIVDAILAAERDRQLKAIVHAADLPLGYRAIFRGGGTLDSKWSIEWQPKVPDDIKSPRMRRKLMRAYKSARKVFLEQVAEVVGSMAVVDLDGSEPTIVKPSWSRAAA